MRHVTRNMQHGTGMGRSMQHKYNSQCTDVTCSMQRDMRDATCRTFVVGWQLALPRGPLDIAICDSLRGPMLSLIMQGLSHHHFSHYCRDTSNVGECFLAARFAARRQVLRGRHPQCHHHRCKHGQVILHLCAHACLYKSAYHVHMR